MTYWLAIGQMESALCLPIAASVELLYRPCPGFVRSVEQP
jgi:hypothetical protein